MLDPLVEAHAHRRSDSGHAPGVGAEFSGEIEEVMPQHPSDHQQDQPEIEPPDPPDDTMLQSRLRAGMDLPARDLRALDDKVLALVEHTSRMVEDLVS